VTTADPDRAQFPVRISKSQDADTVIASASEAISPVIASVSEAIHRAARKERMDCFVAAAPRNDDAAAMPSYSRRVIHASFARTFRLLNSEGAGKAGCSPHPQPRMQVKKAYEHSHHGFAEIIRPSLRNGFNGFLRALPGDRACLSPSSAENDFRQLDAGVEASGPHDFAVRVSAIHQKRSPRPPHPAPRP
jgi:hypothetical protein